MQHVLEHTGAVDTNIFKKMKKNEKWSTNRFTLLPNKQIDCNNNNKIHTRAQMNKCICLVLMALWLIGFLAIEKFSVPENNTYNESSSKSSSAAFEPAIKVGVVITCSGVYAVKI